MTNYEVNCSCDQKCYLSNISKFILFDFYSSNSNICDCYKNESCFSVLFSTSNHCNCDIGDIVQREDIIKITNKVG